MISAIKPPALTGAGVPTTGATGPAGAAATGATGNVLETPGTDFAAVLGQMAMDAIGTVKTGEATAVAGVQGKATVQQVVESVMAAEQTLQASVAIRDKVVSAYLEISRMSI
jgi:flagellar hook-basal body complex protein FliE